MLRKFVSVVLSVCLINCLCGDVYAAVAVPVSATAVVGNTAVSDGFIPADLGTLVDDIYIGSDKTIINIQDLHSDKNTQKNIAEILDFLTKNYNVENIYLEGAFKDLDFNWLKVIKDEKVRSNIATELLTDGKITGAEYFGLFNKNSQIKFKGLEEEKIYKENFIILSKMYENRALLENKIADISKALNEAKVSTYNFFVKSVDELVDLYKNGYISQSKYFSYLISLSQKNDGIPSFKYKTIKNWLELEKSYKSLRLNKVKKEIYEINSILAEKMPYDKYSKIKQLGQSYPSRYYDEIKIFLDNSSSNENYKNKYKNFYEFYDWLQKKNNIDLRQLFEEEKVVLTDLYYSFSKTLPEKNLIFLSYYTGKLYSFFTNEITSSDYEYVKENFKKYCILLENYIPKTDITELKVWYKLADQFYFNNEKRNKIFLENIYNKKIDEETLVDRIVIKNDKRKSFQEILKTTEQPIDIVITGGYHSRGMKALMEGLDVNYAVIMPNVKSADVDESKDKFYRDYLKQISILVNTYQKFIRSSLMNGTWDDPAKVIAIGFLDYDLLNELFGYYKDTDRVKETVSVVQRYISDIFKEKGLSDDTKIENVEVLSEGNFLLTILSEGKERLFYISKDTAKEINDREEVANLQKQKNENTISKNGRKKNGFMTRSLFFMKMVFVLPMMIAMGAGVGGGISSAKGAKRNGLVNNGADITNIDFQNVELIDTVIEQNSEISLHGKITLNNVYVGNGNILKITASDKTTVTVKDIDMTDIGELDINIQTEGEFEIVREDGIVKIYKILRTDFSSFDKKRAELVSLLNKGKIFLPSETGWEQKNEYPVIVFYRKYSKWSDVEKIKKRSEIIYKNSKVFYVDLAEMENMLSSEKMIKEDSLKKFLQDNGLLNQNVCIDTSLLEDKYIDLLYSQNIQNFLANNTASSTFLITDIPLSAVELSNLSTNRENKHNYIRGDGNYVRYSYKDRNWLREVLSSFFPNFKNRTFVFIWPVESVKYTYENANTYAGRPEAQILANEEFKAFMDKAFEYSKSGKDSIVFMPGYLIRELATYFGYSTNDMFNKFSDIVYGDLKDDKRFDVWYNKASAKDVEKIEVLKIDGLTIVMYPEGNRGHNEQAYLKTLMATYNYGKESLDSMLTQAGFPWQANVIYVYEGEETQDLDVEKKLLRNPSIKKGKVSYVYENLKRVFINLYSDMKRFFIKIIPMYTKGNWITVESEIRNKVNIEWLKETLTAKIKLGFSSVLIVPVQKNVLDEQTYGQPMILEKDGIKLPVYSVKSDDGTIYLVGVSKGSLVVWQDVLLEYVKDSLKQYDNNIISFRGVPQISSKRTFDILGTDYVPVVVSKISENEWEIENMGYDTIVDVGYILSRIGNKDLKYPHVAEDMFDVSETVKIVKALKKKSFFGEFADQKSSYVGVKIASDEHIFNNENEENEFMEILNGSDIDFITVVIRDNNLSVHVLNRETTVKENLTRLSGNLHKNGKKMMLEYTFRFFDEFFKIFVRNVSVDVKDIGVDGIKLDLADCSVDDVKSVYEDFKKIRKDLPDIEISVQVSDKVWDRYKDFFEELNITRTLSSKEELFSEGFFDFSDMSDVNYEVSIYRDEDEAKTRLVILSNQRDRLLLKDSYSGNLSVLVERGEEFYLDYLIDRRLEDIFQKVVYNDAVSKLIIPVNMLYAQRLKKDTMENSNVIQAVSNLMRLFKEHKGMKERRRFAYEYGLSQKVNLSPDQEEEIARILRNESDITASSYVKEHYPYIFDYFVESVQTRISVSDSFLFGIYEANVIRKYKQGDFGKVFEFIVDKTSLSDTQQAVDMRQKVFYRALAQVYLFKDKMNIKDVFSIQEDEVVSFPADSTKNNILNGFTRYVMSGYLDITSYVFIMAFPLLNKEALGYMDNRQDTVYKARLLLAGLMKACKKQEVEPILPEIVVEVSDSIQNAVGEDVITNVNNMLSAS